MKINIIGGSGFIGSRLCQRLKDAGERFYVIDKALSNIFPENTKIADVRSITDLSNSINDGSIVINLAAEHKDNVRPASLYDEVNVEGAKNICDVARVKDIQSIIFTSSVSVYGHNLSAVDENGEINPNNDYGRTKFLAEEIFRSWQMEDPLNRKLVIIRPTVVFGEKNRGNVYNLFKQIHSKLFLMIGNGKNKKSMAYVENLAAFIQHSLSFRSGIHIYNYVDKPDLDMNQLISLVYKALDRKERFIRIPYIAAIMIGKIFDFISLITTRDLGISSVRIEKFSTESLFETSLEETGFVSPVDFHDALKRTIKFEFSEKM